MQVGRRLQAFQLEAYHRGSEIKKAHMQARCVLQGTELLTLSGDYAHLSLFKEQQHFWEMTNLHERTGLRMWAFRQGYEGELPGDAQELSRMAVLVMQRRQGRGGQRIGFPVLTAPDGGPCHAARAMLFRSL